ncbi:TolC family protein [Bdellovibrio sp. SKB1291214]|uniref:TolC family protein n=1 Tax=Bdellovibrio sp. SKB1291214 TaxID=1732569 RepID=UPI000B51BB3E|nr:TolC family protein [Bdellovibrio sp. SKB1291214]UYL09895.1 TolC family protein [Bdellovibrio sp. SKB1291214]
MKKTIIALSFFFSIQSRASCPEPLKSGFDAYQCIFEQSPGMQALRFREDEVKALSAKAKQIPNPELDAGLEFTGEKKLEVSLLQPFEIGGKRGSRVERAQAEASFLSAKDLETRIEASNAALESLIRLRQLKAEADLVKDSLSILDRVNRKLKSRPALSPEQKTTLRLFSTFEKTLLFRKLNIEKDVQKTNAFIEGAIGRPITKNDHLDVAAFKKWPSLDLATASTQTTALRTSMAELELAKSEMKLAQSESWPDFRVGPSFERQPDESEASWGIKVGVTIPLWNINGAGKDLAKARMNSAQAMHESTKRQQMSQINSLQKQYEDLIKILREMEPVTELTRSVKDSERLFDRSLISPASLIEMYRSTFELIEEIHRNEIQAMLMWSTAENLKGSFPKELP